MESSGSLTESVPLYHDVSPTKTTSCEYHEEKSEDNDVGQILLGKVFAVIVGITVFLAFIFCFVKGAKDSTLFLLAVNLALSTFVGFSLAYWYHKGVIPADRFYFMVFVGVCIIFQAIVSDIYVWQGKPQSTIDGGGIIPPTVSPTPSNHSTPTPTTRQ